MSSLILAGKQAGKNKTFFLTTIYNCYIIKLYHQ